MYGKASPTDPQSSASNPGAPVQMPAPGHNPLVPHIPVAPTSSAPSVRGSSPSLPLSPHLDELGTDGDAATAQAQPHGGLAETGGSARILDPDYVAKKTLGFRYFVLDKHGRVTKNDQKKGALKGTTLQQQYGDLDLIKVELPDVPKPQMVHILSNPLAVEGKHYRLDLLRQGAGNMALGVEVSHAGGVPQMPAPELSEYARQGLLTEPIAGAEISARVRLAAVGTPFVQQGGAALEVNDGFGFIRESIARSMGITAAGVEAARDPSQRPSKTPQPGDIPSTKQGLDKPAHANTQMLQWMGEDSGAVAELVDHAIKNLQVQLAARPQNRAAEEKRRNLIYRTVTTGDFPVKFGTTVPVPGQNIVLSVQIGEHEQRAMLHRAPADKPNWVDGPLEPANTELSKSLSQLTAFQYRMQQKPDPASHRPMLMMKGLLGVIPDARWPAAFASDGIVACVTDGKVDSSWTSSDDLKAAKADTGARELDFTGSLAVSSVLAPGSLVGVPAGMMKQLSGDYDGDTVHVLLESECPLLFHALAQVDSWDLPKVPKEYSFAGQPAQTPGPAAPGAATLADRFADVKQADMITGTWSTASDLLNTVPPAAMPALAGRVEAYLNARLQSQGLPPVVHLTSGLELKKFVGLGVKVGTDLPKTNLRDVKLGGADGVALDATQWRELGAGLNEFLRKQEKLGNPHARGIERDGVRQNEAKLVDNVLAGQPMKARDDMAPSHHGTIGRIMRAVNEYLRLVQETGKRSGDAQFTAKIQPFIAPDAPAMRERAATLTSTAQAVDVDAGSMIGAVHQLIGDLGALFDDKMRSTSRNRNADRWLVRATSVVQQAQLQSKLDQLPEGPGHDAAVKTLFLDVTNQLASELRHFLDSPKIEPGKGMVVAVSRVRPDGVDVTLAGGVPGHLPLASLGAASPADFVVGLQVHVTVAQVESREDDNHAELALASYWRLPAPTARFRPDARTIGTIQNIDLATGLTVQIVPGLQGWIAARDVTIALVAGRNYREGQVVDIVLHGVPQGGRVPIQIV